MNFWRKLKIQRAQVSLAFVGLFLTLLLFSPGGTTTAADDFVVSIHTDSSIRHVRTEGGTVGELLETAGYEYSEDDLVEPAIDSEMKGPVFNINIYRARPVVVVDEGQRQVVNTPFSSSELIAEDAGFKVFREDILELERVDDFVGAGIIGEQLTITRATPLTLMLYGRAIDHRTHEATVADVLAEKDIVPDEEDTVIPGLDEKITDDMSIQIIRVGSAVVVEEEVINFATEVIWDDSLASGVEIEERPGIDGERVVTYEIEYHNGEEVSRKTLKSVTSIESQARILRVGTLVADGQDNKSLGQSLALSKGWKGSEWVCLHDLWEKESHWNHLAQNPSSTAFGIPQFLDQTWAGTGYQKSTDPSTQILAGFVYIEGRYGTPCNAWNHSVINGWY